MKSPNLIGLYVGLVVGALFLAYSLVKYKKAPEYTDMAVIILSCAGAIVGLDLGYVVVTIDDVGLGKLAEHRLPVVLGALAVVWTAVTSLCRTCKQAIASIK